MSKETRTEPAKKKDSLFVTILSEALRAFAEFKGWDLIFQVLMYGFVIWAVYNLKIVYDFHTSPVYAGFEKYSILEFKISFVVAFIFWIYKTACKKIFFPILWDRIKLENYPTEKEKVAKVEYVCSWIGNIIYYTASTASCYYLFKDEHFFPGLLGGKGTPQGMLKDAPHRVDVPYGVLFYMVQFGSHLYTLIDYCVHKWNAPKFWEMFLHHVLAVFLLIFSFLTNNLRIGIMVLFVHDPCDVFLCINRLNSDLKHPNKPFQYISYILFVFAWIFFRLFAFPVCIIGAGFEFLNTPNGGILYSPNLFLALMLSALVILHVYWFVLILRVMVGLFTGKKHYNVHDNPDKKKA